jgi:DNA-binding transcriptional LysR family regulator
MIGNAHIHFAPKIIDEYTKLFPQTTFNIISPTDVDDFLAGKADIISLSGQAAELPDTVMLPRGNMIFLPVASPEYIKQHGPIMHPDELVNHQVFCNLYRKRYDFDINFKLFKKDKSVAINADNSIRYSNVEMTHQAALDGLGVALSLPLFLCIDDLEAGRLVPVLNGWHRQSHTNYIACKKDDWKIRRIRNFADWYAKKLLAHEKECERRLVALYDRAFLLNLMH